MPKVSLFESVSLVNNPTNFELEVYLEDTRDGRWEDIVTKCRLIKDKKKRDEFKRTMPTCTLSGLFNRRDENSIIEHSGYISMDLDGLDEDLIRVKEILRKDKYVYSVFMSTSGNGLRAIFKIDIKKYSHKRYFESISSYIHSTCGVACDVNGSNQSKPYVVSYDPDLYLNYDKSLEVFDKIVEEVKNIEITKTFYSPADFQEVYNTVIARNINICESYEDWLKVCFSFAETFGEDGRDSFHKVSSISPKYNQKETDKQFSFCLKARGNKKVNLASFYYVCKNHGISVVTATTKKISKYVKEGKRNGLNKQAIVENLRKFEGIEDASVSVEKFFDDDSSYESYDDDDSLVGQMQRFLKENYDIKFNEVSGYFTKDGLSMTEKDINSIFIDMKKIIQKADFNIFTKILNSDFIQVFNPFYEFFHSDGQPVYLSHLSNSKKNYDFETPMIDLLAKTIINNDPKYTQYFLRKWMVSIISSMHKVHSPLLFCLLGKKHGTGKTEWFRRLLPRELSEYYAESKLDKEKDDEILMTNYILIMDDELAGKSKKDSDKLKSITSREFFYLRRPFGSQNEKLRRLAVLCGTSNRLDVMSSTDDNRRIIAVEVIDIDKDLYNLIDKKQLFFEAYNLYKAGFDWRVNIEDQDYLNGDSEKFEADCLEKEIIQKYYEPCSTKDATPMMSSEIVIEIEQLTRQKVLIKMVGALLPQMGYERKSVRKQGSTSKAWMLKKINRDVTFGSVWGEKALENLNEDEDKKDAGF